MMNPYRIAKSPGTHYYRVTIDLIDQPNHDDRDAFTQRVLEDVCEAINELDCYVLKAVVDDMGVHDIPATTR